MRQKCHVIGTLTGLVMRIMHCRRSLASASSTREFVMTGVTLLSSQAGLVLFILAKLVHEPIMNVKKLLGISHPSDETAVGADLSAKKGLKDTRIILLILIIGQSTSLTLVSRVYGLSDIIDQKHVQRDVKRGERC
jgi:hypothetical protein